LHDTELGEISQHFDGNFAALQMVPEPLIWVVQP
jgi:hypothetical protein